MSRSAPGIDLAGSLTVLSTNGTLAPLPDWAQWLTGLGSTLASSPHDTSWWVCLSVPDRRYAALLVAAGFLWSTPVAPEQSLDERLNQLSPGDSVSWLDSHDELRSAEILAVHPDRIEVRRRDHGGFEASRTKMRSHCDTLYRLRDSEEPFPGGKVLSERLDFLAAVTGSRRPTALLCPSESIAVIGVLADLEEELATDIFASGKHRGRLIDLVRPHDRLPRGERTHVSLIASSSDFDRVESVPEPRLAVFDGAQGYDRLRDSLAAHTNVVILDRWAPRSEFAATSALTDRNMMFVEGASIPLPPHPPVIEVFSWVSES